MTGVQTCALPICFPVIDSKFGEGTAELLETLSRTPKKVNEKIISDYYREKVNELLKAKNWAKYKW